MFLDLLNSLGPIADRSLKSHPFMAAANVNAASTASASTGSSSTTSAWQEMNEHPPYPLEQELVMLHNRLTAQTDLLAICRQQLQSLVRIDSVSSGPVEACTDILDRVVQSQQLTKKNAMVNYEQLRTEVYMEIQERMRKQLQIQITQEVEYKARNILEEKEADLKRREERVSYQELQSNTRYSDQDKELAAEEAYALLLHPTEKYTVEKKNA
jgi:hypothetical protein